MGIGIFSQFDGRTVEQFRVEALYTHSAMVSVAARRIAATMQVQPAFGDDVLMAGMLHDIGKLAFVANFAAEYNKAWQLAQTEAMNLCDAERDVLGASHAEFGACILSLWGLPDAIVEAVAYHHEPQRCQHQAFSVLTATHVANALLNDRTHGPATNGVPEVNETYLSALELADYLPDWAAICDAVAWESETT